MALLLDMYPKARVTCCVRDVGWIIDSTERMLRKNPLQVSRLFNYEPGQSVYARAEILMHSDVGFIGQPWSCLREAWFSHQQSSDLASRSRDRRSDTLVVPSMVTRYVR